MLTRNGNNIVATVYHKAASNDLYLLLSSQGQKSNVALKLMRKRLKTLSPDNVNMQIAFKVNKLNSCFKIKNTNDCSDDYVPNFMIFLIVNMFIIKFFITSITNICILTLFLLFVF